MLLERTFETLKQIGNERLQLPIFYECPVSLRFETGDPDLDIFLTEKKLNPKYLRSALWRTSFLYEKTAPFDTLLWVLYRTPDVDSDVDEIIDLIIIDFAVCSNLNEPILPFVDGIQRSKHL